MSLINDALKRAKHAQQKSPPPASPGPTLRAVDPVRRKQSNLGILLPLALVVLVGVGALIVWFAVRAGGTRPSSTTVVQAKSASAPAPAALKAAPTTKTASMPEQIAPSIARPLQPSAKPATAQPVLPTAPSVPLAFVPERTPAPVSTPVLASTQAQFPPAQPTTAPTSTAPTATGTQPVVVASGPPSPPPLPKLQGIFYRPERPAALLNGRTVLIGGTSGEYRVVAISQQSVTVVRVGMTNVLSLAD